jgi:hypothetical protein
MKSVLSVSIFLFFFTSAFSQGIVTDTVYIRYVADSIIPSNYIISSIKDKRGVNPRLISYSQRKKFVLIPVDQELCVPKPLENQLMSNFSIPEKPIDTFCMDIRYFIIERINGRFYNPYILKADIPLYRLTHGDTIPSGVLIYNFTYMPPSPKIKKPEVCEDILAKWNTQFKLDMLGLNSAVTSGTEPPENWILKDLKRSHFLNTSIGGVVGLNFWQIEGELFFTRPETDKKRIFDANIIRYQKTDKFEVIGFGKKSEHLNNRLNNNFTFDISSNLLLGLVKWKEQQEIKLYQIFQFSLSSNQSLCYDRLNSQGWLFRAGLFENLYYTIDMRPGFQAGIYLSTGYKF